MRELFNLLPGRERRRLELLTLLLGISLLFLVFISLGEKRSYFSSLNALGVRQKSYQKLDQTRTERKKEWAKWEGTRGDLEELKKTYFYRDTDVVNQLRLDLQQIFDEAGVHVSQFKYEYGEAKGEAVKKVSVRFSLACSYFSLKRFLDAVERFPRFLFLEKIDFVKTSDSGDSLELNMVLTGYYES
jgi:Tfp pilus assembly protein PilO